MSSTCMSLTAVVKTMYSLPFGPSSTEVALACDDNEAREILSADSLVAFQKLHVE